MRGLARDAVLRRMRLERVVTSHNVPEDSPGLSGLTKLHASSRRTQLLHGPVVDFPVHLTYKARAKVSIGSATVVPHYCGRTRGVRAEGAWMPTEANRRAAACCDMTRRRPGSAVARSVTVHP